ncbi:MAG: DNA-3-methyladenine glycosylase I [Leptospiraceae bacterium]|nr:DNA-3-methyladenine glycosylase I [Leptospiraceae bacterium]MCP5513776.1 DNA-3-methyladenine glycosylase I [Leptospiraceae bacterium]
MDKPKSYCEAVGHLDKSNVHRIYHDRAYGFSIQDDNELFERLILEINQAGLNWTTILNKQENFKKAFHNFQIKKVASYKDKDRQRLLNDAGIIRNRLKIDAAIHNANVILELQRNFGSFKNWLDTHHPKSKEEWVKLFKKNFKFTGGEIVNEFLMSTGYLPGAHISTCAIYPKVLKTKPAWANR